MLTANHTENMTVFDRYNVTSSVTNISSLNFVLPDSVVIEGYNGKKVYGVPV